MTSWDLCESEGRKVWGAHAGHLVDAWFLHFGVFFFWIMDCAFLNAGLLVGMILMSVSLWWYGSILSQRLVSTVPSVISAVVIDTFLVPLSAEYLTDNI